LISNAVKFTHKGNITVSVTLEESSEDMNSLLFSVKDSGVGIAQEKLESIFLPFMQESTSITRKYGGTGLGLAITKRILGLFNSDIKAKSEIGVGSTFYFSIQLKTFEA